MARHQWRRVESYPEALQEAAALLGDRQDLEVCEDGFLLLVEESSDAWVFVAPERRCADCGAYLLSDQGGDYTAIVGP